MVHLVPSYLNHPRNLVAYHADATEVTSSASVLEMQRAECSAETPECLRENILAQQIR